jgi:CTP synthase
MSIHDCRSIYRVPLLLEEQGVVEVLMEKLKLEISVDLPPVLLDKWRFLAETTEKLTQTVKIAVVGKYVELEDSYASVTKALNHAARFAQRKLDLEFIDSEDLEEETVNTNPVAFHQAWSKLCGAMGVLVPGGFGKRGVEGKILAAHWCRTNNKPFLGICLGFQAAVIEFARDVLGLKSANSIEIDPNTDYPVVIEMPEHNTGIMGGTMRLGKRTTVFQAGKPSILMKQLYGNKAEVEERHRHRYEVNPKYVSEFEAAGLIFVGKDQTGHRMEIFELQSHPFYTAVQFHPEYLSRPFKPSPPYVGLLLASSGQLDAYLADPEKFEETNLYG